MVRTVFWWFFWGLIAALIVVWLLSGGIQKIENASGNYSFSGLLSSGMSVFSLPWAVPPPQGIDITNLVQSQEASFQSGENEAENQSQTQSQAQAQTFGNQSSYGNTVVLSADGATASDPEQQYVTIENDGQSAIDLSGWSLQSALSGVRAYIPLGANFFELGQLNAQTDIELAPGAVAVITSGSSPVGTSFRENQCSGYLEQLQQYTPAIETQCPSPSDNASQAAQYGQSCADYVSSLPFCTFPQTAPSGVSLTCQTYVQTTFSYNGCVNQYGNTAGFALDTWRIYLDSYSPLWRSDHDTIRLLDTHGEIVAVASY